MSANKKTTEARKSIFLEALKKNLFIVTAACEATGIKRQMYYDWIKNDPQFKLDVDNLEDMQIDFVETQLLKRIKEGSDSSIQFYLKTKGKRAGFGTQIDVTTNGESINNITTIKLIEIKKNNDDDKTEKE
jgi:hypothetical protein